MQHLVDRLCQLINEEHISTEDNKKVLKIDALFGSFALDIIYNIGFDLDRDFLHNHALYQVTLTIDTNLSLCLVY